ncbi:MAG: hypothetical protein MUF43_09810 [Flavobacterium sp.]|nr:hypothetical protein [Flavobacterium sp.]
MFKRNPKITFVYFFFLLTDCTYSCNEKELEPLDLDLKDLNLNIAFKNSYKVSGINDINKIVNLFLDEILYGDTNSDASGRLSSEEVPNGLEFQLEGDILTVEPLEDEIGVESSCGEGWTNHGICLNKSCVAEKVEKAMAPVSEAEEGCILVKVIRTTTHARVCSKDC